MFARIEDFADAMERATTVGGNACDNLERRPSANQDGELYSCVADLYHEFRPRYPEELMNHAAAHIPVNGRILEIGSGPWNGNSSSIETRISSDVYRTKQWHDSKGKTCLS